jgi:hypothetical protein
MIGARAAIPAGSPNIDRNQERAKPEPYLAGASSRWGALYPGDTVMLRKTMITLFAAASVIMLASSAASARGGGHGGGGGGHHGGGGGSYHGGYGGGAIHGAAIGGVGFRGAAIGGASGFRAVSVGNGLGRPAMIGSSGYRSAGFVAHGLHGGHIHRGFHGRRFLVGAGLGFGLYAPYGYSDDYYGYPAYVYDDSYYEDGGCYLVQRRIHTRHGWRIRHVQVCG